MDNYQKLVELVKEAGIHESIAELLDWDEEVTMPAGAIERKALEKGVHAAVSHRLATSDEIGKLIKAVERKKLNAEQQAMVREIKFDYDRAINVPEELVKEMAETSTRAVEAWQKARKNNDFPLFKPHLKKIIDLKKKEAAAIDATKNPYDVLVEEYESGISTAEMANIFDEIKQELVPIIARISKAKQVNTRILGKQIPEQAQREFSLELLKYIGFDFSKGRLDVAEHPFTGYWRITTRYTDGFAGTIGSTIHEVGHAFYEHNLPFEHFGTPLGESRSLSVHESQSRLWENHIGKSKAFWQGMFPKLKKAYGLKTSLDEFYKAINCVQPGFIRVNADEVTYTMHIILRFELERALIEGRISVDDIPSVWKNKMRGYLGIDVPNDREGALQDIHWPSGLIGYFPTYSLGNVLAAQLFEAMTRDIDGLEEKISRGEFAELHSWLKDKIHSKGRRYPTKELIKMATGEEPNPRAYLRYLHNKFGEIYNL